MKNSFFMVFVEGQRSPAVTYTEIENAEREAKRLTELTGKKAFVLCSIKSFEMAERYKVNDCRPEGDDLPF